MVVPANPGPPKAYTEWNGPWRLEGKVEEAGSGGAAPGGREGEGAACRRARAQQAGVQLGSGAKGSRGQTANNGDPASEAAPGKKAWAQRPGQWGRQAWKDAPCLCFLC